MTRKQKRLAVLSGLLLVLAAATALILFALREQIVFFYGPSEIRERAIAVGQPIRLGGLVKEGSWTRTGEVNNFVVTDGETEVTATFVGLLPDLFREGQGVVAEGSLAADGTFSASKVLAKHDETYMPKEVVEALKDRGEWQRGETAPGS